MLVNPHAPLPQVDVFPRGQALQHGKALSAVSDLPDFNRDYSGRMRQGAVWGAYASEHSVNIGREVMIGSVESNSAPCR